MDVFPAQYVDGQMFKSPLQSMRNVILSTPILLEILLSHGGGLLPKLLGISFGNRSNLSAYNVRKQVLDTKDSFGYLIADVMTEQLSTEIVSQLSMLASTIRTRIV
ncbi:hypothetical protein BASA60_010425 [Batrachochytrium salamandrivorans]|nr:hypothetical protein BASA60_010425 [Batrachochytrium salamandrivorans]